MREGRGLRQAPRSSRRGLTEGRQTRWQGEPARRGIALDGTLSHLTLALIPDLETVAAIPADDVPGLPPFCHPTSRQPGSWGDTGWHTRSRNRPPHGTNRYEPTSINSAISELQNRCGAARVVSTPMRSRQLFPDIRRVSCDRAPRTGARQLRDRMCRCHQIATQLGGNRHHGAAVP